MISLLSMEKERKFLEETDRPIIIWGTAIAGQMAHEVCRKLNISVRAFGDNNTQKQGTSLLGLEVLSPKMINDRYPQAVIIIGTFIYNIETAIIRQLSGMSNGFIFIGRLWTEYYYEIEMIGRKITDRELFIDTLNDIETDENAKWRFKVNRKCISEYKYIVTDYKCDDLYEVIRKNYLIKNLYLVISSELITSEFLELIRDLQTYSNIGHINLITDGKISPNEVMANTLKRMFFIIKFPSDCDNVFGYYEREHLSEDIFRFTDKKDVSITEKMICDCVCRYTNGKLKNGVKLSDKKVYIVQLFNGLANQMLMCLFGKILEKESDRLVIYDDTLLSLDINDKQANIDRLCKWLSTFNRQKVELMVNETIKHNSFYCFERAEVAEIFKTPIRLLSDYFDDNTWYEYLKNVKADFVDKYRQVFPIGQLLMENGINICLMQDDKMPKDFIGVKNNLKFNTYILEFPYNRSSATELIVKNDLNGYYMGIWTMGEIKDWLFTNRSFARNVFQFDVTLKGDNISFARMICETESIVIHIRRGDFPLCNLETDNNFFDKSISKIEKMLTVKEKHYFVFSDDIDWCRTNSELLGLDNVKDRVTYIVGNEGKNSYIDMYLMSLGNILVPSYNSTFSYMALLLSVSIKKCVDVLRYRYFCREGIDNVIEIVDV